MNPATNRVPHRRFVRARRVRGCERTSRLTRSHAIGHRSGEGAKLVVLVLFGLAAIAFVLTLPSRG
jgi:hypothetical protein